MSRKRVVLVCMVASIQLVGRCTTLNVSKGALRPFDKVLGRFVHWIKGEVTAIRVESKVLQRKAKSFAKLRGGHLAPVNSTETALKKERCTCSRA